MAQRSGPGRVSQLILPKGTSPARRGLMGPEGAPATHGSGMVGWAGPAKEREKR